MIWMVRNDLIANWFALIQTAASRLKSPLLIVVFLTGVFSSVAFGQASLVSDETATPIPGAGHDLIQSLSETVNPANGSLSVGLSPAIAPSRGVGIPFSFVYSSGSAHYLTAPYPYQGPAPSSNAGPLSSGGWAYSMPSMAFSGYSTSTNIGAGDGFTCSYLTGFVFDDAQGQSHSFPVGAASYKSLTGEGGQNEPCNSSPLTASDSEFSAQLTVTQAPGSVSLNYADFYDNRDRTHYHFSGYTPGDGIASFPEYIEDRNGNVIQFSNLGKVTNNALTVTDTAGRSAIAVSGGVSSSSAVTASGLSYSVTWGKTSAAYSVPSKLTYQVSGPYTCPAPAAIQTTQSVISSITLPNRQSYTFYYGDNAPDPSLANPYGLISEIVYPDGGWVKYTWKFSDSYNESIAYTAPGSNGSEGQAGDAPVTDGCIFEYESPVIETRTVGVGTTPQLTQSFQYGTVFDQEGDSWTTKTTTVTTTDNTTNKQSTTTYSYTPLTLPQPAYSESQVAGQLPVEHTVQYTDWGGSVPIRTENKQWFDQFTIQQDSVTEGAGAAAQTRKTVYCYFGYQCAGSTLPSEIDEYDFGQTSITRSTIYTYPSPTPSGQPCKIVKNGAAGAQAETDYYFDNQSTLCGAVSGSTTTAVSNLPPNTHDETAYGPTSSSARGNVTSMVQVLNTGTSPTTTYSYDETGQMLSMTDPCGSSSCNMTGGSAHTTTFSYADNPSQSSNTNTYLTLITKPVANGIAQTNSSSYDYSSGNVTSTTDQNNLTTTYSYTDPLRRITDTYEPTSAQNGAQPHSSFSYTDGPGGSIMTTDPDGVVNVTYYDGFGRTIEHQLPTDPSGTDITITTYNGLGQVASVTNPYRNTNDPTYGIIKYSYDSLGRKTLQTDQDGSVKTWMYSGNVVDYYDELQNHSQRTYDSFGDVTKVLEPNASGSLSAETDYQYDDLGNLMKVDQWGGPSGSAGDRMRMFAYDNLSRLIASTNPEKYSGMTPPQLSCVPGSSTLYAECFTYDADSNLIQHTDNRNITTMLSYDVLNRLVQKSYSDGTPTAFFQFDTSVANVEKTSSMMPPLTITQTNLIGRLSVEGTVLTSGTGYSYDEEGRTTISATCTPRTCGQIPNHTIFDQYNLNYTYDLAGRTIFASRGTLAQMSNASPNAGYYYGGINLHYQGAGQVQNATSDLPTGSGQPTQNIATNLLYNPLGGISGVGIGGEFSQTTTYAPRGWISMRSSSDLAANGATTDTFYHDAVGNVSMVSDTLLGQYDYCYDQLNRLTIEVGPVGNNSFSCPSGAAGVSGNLAGSSYGYDAWGNMDNRSALGSGSAYQVSFVPTTSNQIPQASYDAAGNLLNDGVHTYIYDAEGRISSVDNAIAYAYDALGRRISSGPVGQQPTTDFLYDTGGTLVTTVGSDFLAVRTSLYAAGEHWGDYTAVTGSGPTSSEFRLGDEVGTLLDKFDQNGNVVEDCASGPFGESLQCDPSVDFTETHFSDKKRDQENNLDFFGARYYSSTLGRFMSPDVPFYSGQFDNPQDLNLYSYVHNNPLTNLDPDGHDCIYATGVGSGYEVISGDCLSDTDSGIYVNGTVTSANYSASNNSIGYTYTAYDTGNLGSGVIGNVPTPQPMDEGVVTPGDDGLGLIAGGRVADYVVGRIAGFFGRETEAVAEGIGKATVQDILKGATREGGTRADIYSKPGGVAQATKDFNSLEGKAVKTGGVTIKDLPNGGRAVLRSDPSTWSTDGRPSLDIQPTSGGYKTTAIRYNP